MKINENKTKYKDLSYKIYVTEEDNIKFHEIDFLKKYGALYDLLDNLSTSKITINNANIYQISFISSLMHEYDKDDLFHERTKISVKKGKSWKSKPLIK